MPCVPWAPFVQVSGNMVIQKHIVFAAIGWQMFPYPWDYAVKSNAFIAGLCKILSTLSSHQWPGQLEGPGASQELHSPWESGTFIAELFTSTLAVEIPWSSVLSTFGISLQPPSLGLKSKTFPLCRKWIKCRGALSKGVTRLMQLCECSNPPKQ